MSAHSSVSEFELESPESSATGSTLLMTISRAGSGFLETIEFGMQTLKRSKPLGGPSILTLSSKCFFAVSWDSVGYSTRSSMKASQASRLIAASVKQIAVLHLKPRCFFPASGSAAQRRALQPGH